MLRSFADIWDKVRKLDRVTVSVAVAQDKDILEAIKEAREAGLAEAILVGDAAAISPLLTEVGLSADTPVVHEPDPIQAAKTAVALVKTGQAQVLMKGLINSSDFLRAVLDRQNGLKAGKLLSHLAAFQVPGQEKLVFITDGGINIAPNLAEKKEILINAMLALHCVGISEPKVAVLTANEVVHPQMIATIHARELADMAVAGQLPAGVVEGPIALDVALSAEAAKHKGITSKIAGQVDLFLVPNIECGNILGKALVYYACSKMVGIILGASNPIVLTSRAETVDGKLNSIALACLAACNGRYNAR